MRETEVGSHNRRLKVWGAAAALIVLPVLVFRGVDAAAWRLPADAIFLAGLTIGIGIAYEVAARLPARLAYGAGIGLALWAALLTFWINGAVGIIGSEDNPANMLFAAVLAVAGIGAVVSMFRPLGLAAAMVATTIAQLAVFAIAWIGGYGFTGPITVFFAGLWLTAAWLFRRAAHHRGAFEARS